MAFLEKVNKFGSRNNQNMNFSPEKLNIENTVVGRLKEKESVAQNVSIVPANV